MASYWIIYSFLILGSGVLCDRKLERRQAVSSCSGNNDDMFYCSKKLCIEWESVCDGYKDCFDGSDETKDLCDRYEYGTNMTMDCGRVPTKNEAISEEGDKESKVGIERWYVLIFRLQNSEYNFICEGSIIAPNVVISDSKYFVTINSPLNISINDGRNKIVAGKHHSSLYTDINNEFTQTINVQTIYINQIIYKQYEYSRDYYTEIAFIVLENKISFTNGLAAPVCIDWRNKYGVFNGDQGKVIVFNDTARLKRVPGIYLERNLSYINIMTCQKYYPGIFSDEKTYDRFCAKRLKEEKVTPLRGSSITFFHSNSFFLTGLTTTSTNFDDDIVIFKDIKFYVHWIRGLFNKHVTVNSCVLPTVEGVVYSYEDSNETLSHGTLIDRHLTVIENCDVGYHNAYPNRFRVCKEKGKWSSNSNKFCFKMCSPLNSDSLDIKCSYNCKYANCSNLSIPDTTAKLSCKPTHSAPIGLHESPQELICQSNGLWNKPLYRCNPNCGRVYTKIKLLINNGTKAPVGSAPWNVGIYQFDKTNSKHDLICGGSIISPNLVVSAAHCFWNQGMLSNTIPISDGLYKIAVGKYDRNFTTIDNEFTKIINVKIIYLTEDFNGPTGSYFGDIAIIVLENRVSFSEGVAPVCIDWNGNYKVFNGDQGKIVSWGKTENSSFSSSLLEASLPYINRSTCREIYKNEFERYVTVDKFCAGSELGQGVCQGDSGAGLCFLHSDLYYLTGVASAKDPDKNYSIATFTEIKYHIEWIRRLFDRFNNV